MITLKKLQKNLLMLMSFSALSLPFVSCDEENVIQAPRHALYANLDTLDYDNSKYNQREIEREAEGDDFEFRIGFFEEIRSYRVSNIMVVFKRLEDVKLWIDADGDVSIPGSPGRYCLSNYTDFSISERADSVSWIVMDSQPVLLAPGYFDSIEISYSVECVDGLGNQRITKTICSPYLYTDLQQGKYDSLVFRIVTDGDQTFNNGVFTVSSDLKYIQFDATVDPYINVR